MTFLRRIIGVIGVCIIIAVIGAGIMAYLVITTRGEREYDGLGRELYVAHWTIRVFTAGYISLWAGFLWFIVDFVVFGGGLGVGILLASYGFKSPADARA